jgi:hypothetical protein
MAEQESLPVMLRFVTEIQFFTGWHTAIQASSNCMRQGQGFPDDEIITRSVLLPRPSARALARPRSECPLFILHGLVKRSRTWRRAVGTWVARDREPAGTGGTPAR